MKKKVAILLASLAASIGIVAYFKKGKYFDAVDEEKKQDIPEEAAEENDDSDSKA